MSDLEPIYPLPQDQGADSIERGGSQESEDLGANAFPGAQGGSQGISLLHLTVTRSQQGRARKGTPGRDQPSYPCAPGHLGEVLTACLWE